MTPPDCNGSAYSAQIAPRRLLAPFATSAAARDERRSRCDRKQRDARPASRRRDRGACTATGRRGPERVRRPRAAPFSGAQVCFQELAVRFAAARPKGATAKITAPISGFLMLPRYRNRPSPS